MAKSQRHKGHRKKEKAKCKICGAGNPTIYGFCLDHLPDDLRCSHPTRKGRRCRLPVLEGSDVCHTHLVTMQRGYGKGKYGWVYVYSTCIEHRQTGFLIYKIGRSVNPDLRAGEFAAANPYGRMLFAGFMGREAKSREGEVHRELQEYWLHGELFVLPIPALESAKGRLRTRATKWKEWPSLTIR